MQKQYVNKSYRSFYPSVFEGYELEIHIVDHCNLQCANCNHFSPLAEPFFIDEETFRNQLMLVKETLPTLKDLMLLGGEPTLHPNLFNLCKIARGIFPESDIRFLTNGIVMNNTWTEETFEQFKNIRVFPCVTKYLDTDYSNLDKLLDKYRYLATGYEKSRILFTTTLVNVKGTEDGNKQFNNCSKYRLPCFTLKDYKIYICPFAAHIEHFCKKFNIDIPNDKSNYLVLDKNLNLQQLHDFCFTKKNICNYCRDDSIHFWDRSEKTCEEFTKNNKELYLTNYPLYYKRVVNSEFYPKVKDTELIKLVDENYFPNLMSKLNKRFGQGKIDIIIPFYKINKELVQKCFDSLLEQSIIEDCVIYLISDSSPDEEYVYDLFSSNGKINSVFLKMEKNSGPGAARNLGIKHSFNDYFFCLDIDDYLINDGLIKLYNTITEKDLDILMGHSTNGIKTNLGDSHCILYKRKFIYDNNLKYGENRICEDQYFHDSIYYIKDKKLEFMEDQLPFYFYVNNSPTSISSDYSSEQLFINQALIKTYSMLEYLNNNENVDKIQLFKNFHEMTYSISIFDGELDKQFLYNLFNLYNSVLLLFNNKIENFYNDYLIFLKNYNLKNTVPLILNNRINYKFFLQNKLNDLLKNNLINQNLYNNFLSMI